MSGARCSSCPSLVCKQRDLVGSESTRILHLSCIVVVLGVGRDKKKTALRKIKGFYCKCFLIHVKWLSCAL